MRWHDGNKGKMEDMPCTPLKTLPNTVTVRVRLPVEWLSEWNTPCRWDEVSCSAALCGTCAGTLWPNPLLSFTTSPRIPLPHSWRHILASACLQLQGCLLPQQDMDSMQTSLFRQPVQYKSMQHSIVVQFCMLATHVSACACVLSFGACIVSCWGAPALRKPHAGTTQDPCYGWARVHPAGLRGGALE